MKLYLRDICDKTVLDQCHSHVIVWCDKNRYNIRHINPYKSDTNVEDINPKNVSDGVNI